MFAIFSRKKNRKHYFRQSSQNSKRKSFKETPEEKQLESFRKYRDSVVWYLLQLERDIDRNDLSTYWKLIDSIMDLSPKSALTILKNRYGYRVRKLHPNEKKKNTSKELYRLENNSKHGGYRDVCANTLLRKTVDLLQGDVKRLI